VLSLAGCRLADGALAPSDRGDSVILEVASLMVRPGTQAAFERALDKALRLITDVEGYLSHELCRSVEREQHYALLIEWRSLEDHSRGFVRSNEFARCRELLQDYLQAPPQVEHFRAARRPDPQRPTHTAD
jgi:heme-degrading monooxygenase HmoA